MLNYTIHPRVLSFVHSRLHSLIPIRIDIYLPQPPRKFPSHASVVAFLRFAAFHLFVLSPA
jgi:hypothetical protein